MECTCGFNFATGKDYPHRVYVDGGAIIDDCPQCGKWWIIDGDRWRELVWFVPPEPNADDAAER